MVLALVVELKMYLHQMDVSTAYLNSELTEEVYMKQPEGYVDQNHPEQVLKLNKAIYGLKQSGRAWNSKLDSVLRRIGFTRCKHEPCLYKQTRKGKMCLLTVYVDDIIVACQSKDDLLVIKSAISNSFDCVEKGPMQFFLGLRVQRDGECGAISLDQTQYIQTLLKQYKMEDCRSAATPLDAGFQVSCSSKDCVLINPKEYQSAIGALMYIALATRPDILHSVSKLTQGNVNPHSEHEAGIKHVLRYLATTMDLKLHYKASGKDLYGYVDADWGNNSTDRRSYTGYVFYLADGAISLGIQEAKFGGFK